MIGPAAVGVLCPDLTGRRNPDIIVGLSAYGLFYLAVVARPRCFIDGARPGGRSDDVFLVVKDASDRVADSAAGAPARVDEVLCPFLVLRRSRAEDPTRDRYR